MKDINYICLFIFQHFCQMLDCLHTRSFFKNNRNNRGETNECGKKCHFPR